MADPLDRLFSDWLDLDHSDSDSLVLDSNQSASLSHSFDFNHPLLNTNLASSSHSASFPSDSLDPSLISLPSSRPISDSIQPFLIHPNPHPPSHPQNKNSNHSIHASDPQKQSSSHPPVWDDRPSPEEYKLLSSKQKRQLRNKISARNFRHRRKEHISDLEHQVAHRDQTIDSLSAELRLVKLENKHLKTELDNFKSKWSDLLKKIEEISIPGPASPSALTNSPQQASSGLPVPPPSPRQRSAKSSNLLSMPNLHKDLGSHSRKPFNGTSGAMAGGNVGVHTTLIPEIPVNLYQPNLTSAPQDPLDWIAHPLQEILSPQALIELQVISAKATSSSPPLALPFAPGQINLISKFLSTLFKDKLIPNDFLPSKLLLSRDPPSATTSLSNTGLDENVLEQELVLRLTRMLIEPIKLDNRSSPGMLEIDEEKLRGLLEGRLELRVHEASPPPPYHEADHECSEIVEGLERAFSRVSIGVDSF